MKESLAFLFYRDGIREIRFHKGLEAREVYDFLSIVRKSDLVNRMEDDLVTLLWEKDFSHISFTSLDDFLEAGATFVPATERISQTDWSTRAPGKKDSLKRTGTRRRSPMPVTEKG